MKELRYTLVTDGSSDAALKPVLTWLLKENGVSIAIQPEWADLRRSSPDRKLSLAEKIQSGIHSRWNIRKYVSESVEPVQTLPQGLGISSFGQETFGKGVFGCKSDGGQTWFEAS